MATPNVNLGDFSEWLFMRARIACAVTLPTGKSNTNSHVNTHSKNEDGGKKNSSENVPKLDTNSKGKVCYACDGKSHTIYECRKFIGMALRDKWETVKNKKLCRICLENHHISRCDSSILCGESGCTFKHHRLLHNHEKNSKYGTIVWSATGPTHHKTKRKQNRRRHLRSSPSKPNCYFTPIHSRHLTRTERNTKRSSQARLAFLDDGSDMTLIEHWVVEKLGITGEAADLFLEWTAKIVRKERNSKSVSLTISGTRTDHKKYEITEVRTVKSLNLPPQTIDVEQLRKDFKFSRRIPFEGYSNETPRILIGLRHCRLTTPHKICSGKWCEPMATKTLLGWEVHGSNASSAHVSNLNLHVDSEMNDDEKLNQSVARFFSLENFGVKKPEQTIEAQSDKRAKQILELTTKRIGDRFETGLLWKYDNISLPNSLPMAKRRLLSLEKRLRQDPELELKF